MEDDRAFSASWKYAVRLEPGPPAIALVGTPPLAGTSRIGKPPKQVRSLLVTVSAPQLSSCYQD